MKRIYFTLFLALLAFIPKGFTQGCMEPSGSSTGPQIIGYIQAENSTSFLGKDASGNDLTENSFYFQKARFGVTGLIPYNFSYYFMTEMSPTQGGPHILDAFLSWKAAKSYLKVSAGQFKTPFGLELTTPCQSLYTINRSLVVNELASPFRDQGIMLSGGSDSLHIFGLEKTNVLSYALAFTNGTGINTKDNNRSKDIVGRLVFAPCNFFQAGGSYHYGKQKNPDAKVTKEDVRMRWGADIQFKKSFGKFGFLSQSEYIFAKDEGSMLVGGGCGSTPEVVQGTFKRNGFYSQLMIQTPWKLEPLVKIESFDPDMDKSNTLSTSYSRSTYTFGFSYYVNDWTRIQANYMYNMEGSSSTDYTQYNEKMNDMLVFQLQFTLK